MGTATTAVTILLVVVLLASAAAKLRKVQQAVEPILAVGVPAHRVPQLAALEVAGAVGLLVGFAVPVVGIAAAVGVVLYFVGAVVAHLRVGDRAVGPALFVLVLAVAVLVLRVLGR